MKNMMQAIYRQLGFMVPWPKHKHKTAHTTWTTQNTKILYGVGKETLNMKYVNKYHSRLSHMWNWLILPCVIIILALLTKTRIFSVFILISIMYSKEFSVISQFYICYEVLLPGFGSYPITQSTVPTPNGNTANCQPIRWWPHFVW